MFLKFPLKLSCGHFTRRSINDPGCTCSTPTRSYKSNGESPIDKALEQFNGQWRQVLENYGARLPAPNRHGPCPCCGGKDRFRFDDKNGYGTWFCSQCDPQSGGGLKLLSNYLGKPTIDVAKELVGDDDYKTTAPKRTYQPKDEYAIRKANIKQAIKGAQLLMQSAVMAEHPYMMNKGFSGEWSTNGEPIYSKSGVIGTGELLLVPFYKNDELVNVQKITIDGTKRPLWGGDMQGVQHVIDGKTSRIAVVEGYATGVTVNMLTGYKTYCGFNTGNLSAAVKKAKIDHPDAKIVIFADHDELDINHNRRPGEHYANEAAAPFGAIVALPLELGDWDDYRQKYGIDKCKEAMRDAIKKDMGVVTPAKIEPRPEPKVEPVAKEVPAQAVETKEPQPAPAFGSWIGKAPAQTKKPVGLKALPDGVCLDGVDIDHPPGLAGDIVEYMKAGAHRKLEGGAFSAMAIQCMAMAGSNLKGFKGCKLSLITITLGVSASGKDRAQAVTKKLLNEVDINVYGDIRSDKDVIRSAAYDNGRCFYIKDEAHTLLGGAMSGKDKNTSSIPATLMEMATTTLYKLSKLHTEEFEGNLVARKSRLEKTISAKEEIKLGYNKDLEKAKITVIDHDMAKIKEKIKGVERIIESIERGIKNPALNLAALSTPQKLSSIIDEDSIESGFLGRALIFDCGVERVQNDKLSDFDSWLEMSEESHENKVLYERIKMGVGLITQISNDTSKARIEDEFNGIEHKTVATPEASRMIFNIAVHYDQYQYLNHARLGALYARIAERVMSVSSSLALCNVIDGNITIDVEHVKYALFVALRSIDHLESNLRINEAASCETIESKLEGIKEAILKRLIVNKGDKDEGWRYKSYLKDYLKRQKYYQDIAKDLLQHNQDAFENSLMALRSEGKILVDGKKVKLK